MFVINVQIKVTVIAKAELMSDAIFTVMPKNRPGPTGAYKLCHTWLKGL